MGINLQGGSFGTIAADANVSLPGKNVYNRLAGGYSRSDGGSENSDFKKGNMFYNGGYNGSDINVRWQLGVSTMDYGANTFYSAAFNNQYEENRRYMAANRREPRGR